MTPKRTVKKHIQQSSSGAAPRVMDVSLPREPWHVEGPDQADEPETETVARNPRTAGPRHTAAYRRNKRDN